MLTHASRSHGDSFSVVMKPVVLSVALPILKHFFSSSKFYIPYLHAFCLATGPVRTSEVIVRFIMEAENEQEVFLQ